MKPALLLVDLQNDYLATPQLQPAAGAVVHRAAALLEQCRRRGVPVVHVYTTVQHDPDNRMPHWKTAGKWICVAGTTGHNPPPSLRPLPHEPIVSKQFFSAFGNPEMDSVLRDLCCDTLILAGVHMHACIRATALDGFQRGYVIHLAEDAIGSDDHVHAASTRRHLLGRGMRFDSTDRILDPAGANDVAHVAQLVARARAAWPEWRRVPLADRVGTLLRLADRLEAGAEELGRQITGDIGKPITMAIGEVRRSAELCRATAAAADHPQEMRLSPKSRIRYEPLGVVGIVTPWNNPVAIPVGKIAPAILYGNTVVWKPSPAAAGTAQAMQSLFESATPKGVINLCPGDHTVAHALAEHAGVDGVTLSGSPAAGRTLQEICAARNVPFQGELGGNNASIVWDDTDQARAADEVARGAFSFAGQRCTANRRAIVAGSIFDSSLEQLTRATAALPWGDPLDPKTLIGPLVNPSKRDDVIALLQRARNSGCRIIMPHAKQPNHAELIARGPYHPPAIVVCDDPAHEIVQEETFGPVLVVQKANDFAQAIQLLNGVRQGLVAALFSDSPVRREQFMRDARAGVLKLDRSAADADAVSPLGGWKASGVGPAEHGPCDREFFCRVQTIYDG